MFRRFIELFLPAAFAAMVILTLNGLVLLTERRSRATAPVTRPQRSQQPQPTFKVYEHMRVLIGLDMSSAVTGVLFILINEVFQVQLSGRICYAPYQTLYILLVQFPYIFMLSLITAGQLIQIGICSDRVMGIKEPMRYRARNHRTEALKLGSSCLLASFALVSTTISEVSLAPDLYRQLLFEAGNDTIGLNKQATNIQQEFCYTPVENVLYNFNLIVDPDSEGRVERQTANGSFKRNHHDFPDEEFPCDPQFNDGPGAGSCAKVKLHFWRPFAYAISVIAINVVLAVKSVQLATAYRQSQRKQSTKLKSATKVVPASGNNVHQSSSSTSRRKKKASKSAVSSKTLTMVVIMECAIDLSQSLFFVLAQTAYYTSHWLRLTTGIHVYPLGVVFDRVSFVASAAQFCSHFWSFFIMSRNFRTQLMALLRCKKQMVAATDG